MGSFGARPLGCGPGSPAGRPWGRHDAPNRDTTDEGLALPCAHAVVILGATYHPEESPAIAKRKPPSQRPERKLDDTAKAIARIREEAKPEKSGEPGHAASDASKPHLAHLAKSLGPRKPGGPAITPSTKRPKMGGGGA
jgi:hypothetical protein